MCKRGRQEVLRKPVAVWNHLDVDFAAEAAEGGSGEELGADVLLPIRPPGRRRVRSRFYLIDPHSYAGH